MDEYKAHLQRQTCYVAFQSNKELIVHMEGYRSRERLLVAELERCRMHLARFSNSSSGKERRRSYPEEDEEENEDNQPESSPPSRLLRCPFKDSQDLLN